MTDKDKDKSENDVGAYIKKSISPIITLVTFITLVFGGFFWFEKHYASAEEHDQLEQRFEIKIRNDILRETNARVWQLEDRVNDKPDDITAKEEPRRLPILSLSLPSVSVQGWTVTDRYWSPMTWSVCLTDLRRNL